MEKDIALAVGQALFSKLSTFQELGGESLRSVCYVHDERDLDQVILDFDSVSVIVRAMPDDDSVDFSSTRRADLQSTPRADVSQGEFWKKFIGVPFGWGWVTVNQQGYCDGLLLSFKGIEPQVLMNVVASSLKLRLISSVSDN